MTVGGGTRSSSTRGGLANVHWIGGGSGAGKSTVARRIADRHGLRLYSTDDAMHEHASRCSPGECPRLDAFREMTMDERWVSRSPKAMLDTFHWFRGEAFDPIVEDLLRIAPGERVIAEGFRLLPGPVEPLLEVPDRAVWLIPTPEFRRSAFEARGTLWDIAGRTGDQERALANLLERDRLFTEELRSDVERLGLAWIAVDGSMDEDALTARAEAHLELVRSSA